MSSTQLANISFAGNFSGVGLYASYAPCIYIQVLRNTSANISLSNIGVQGDTRLVNLVNGYLSSASVLSINDIDIDWQVDNSFSTMPFLISLSSSEYFTVICSTDQHWPQLNINSVKVYNRSAIAPYQSAAVPGLLFSYDIQVSINDVIWSSPVNQIITTKTKCAFGFYPPNPLINTDFSYPPITINGFVGYEFGVYTTSPFYIIGGQVTLAGLNFFELNILVNGITPQQIGLGVFQVYPTSFQLVNSQFNFLGWLTQTYSSNATTADYSIFFVSWNSGSVNQLTDYSLTTNLVQNVQFTENIIRPITLGFVAISELSNSAQGITVHFDSCLFIDNNGTIVTVNPGGAIQVIAALITNSPYSISYSTVLPNQINVTNSSFIGNIANTNGGAIALISASANISNCTFRDNTVHELSSGSDATYNCDIGSTIYNGGGAIFATGSSTIDLSQNVIFTYNEIYFGGPYVGMAGGILCCSPNNNITVVSDGTTTFSYNRAPVISDMTCSSHAFHQKLPTCQFKGSVNETQDYCELGPFLMPVWLDVLIAVVVVGVVAAIAFAIYRRQKQKHQYDPLLE
eukprot:TRINITY_DN6114_c0_g1_i2.p1 TRINITY_DN6114_c0_g1~~TRINITY_DN6114_c0_g1_i2.p1  ORF type:complete len:573 (-),score=105.08 TRINITY_DN6114_c0_g1_i2:23-1741(-)